MNARQLALRHGEETPGIVIPKVRLPGEGQPLEVVEALDRRGLEAGVREGAPVEDHALAGPRHDGPEALELKGSQLCSRRPLDAGVPDHGWRLIPPRVIPTTQSRS